MKQLLAVAFSLSLMIRFSFAQGVTPDCSGLNATYTTKESRCASTGSITFHPAGGSGNYSYRVLTPTSSTLTSSSTITGLAPGNYAVQIKDMETGCSIIKENITVGGTYSDPRFSLDKTDLTCISSSDGTITTTGLQSGRSPFIYKIVSPSPSGTGTSNQTGVFNSLPAGNYYIQLLDSCGGIQTRSVAIGDYNWSITNNAVAKLNCNTISASITLTDNKGNTNQSGNDFNGFKYGAVNPTGDTTWYSSSNFTYTKTPLRKVTIVVKDRCQAVKSVTWQNPPPSLSSGQLISNTGCSTFDVKVTGPANFSTGAIAYLKQGPAIIQSNATGEFTNVPYGSYCIEVKDFCYDTTITRCFLQKRPIPSVSPNVDTFNTQCSTFDVKINGPANLFNATYRLFSSTNTLIATNSTGIFTSLAYGNYCMRIVSASPCYDTTISRCFNILQPKPVLGAPKFTDLTCSGFTATISPLQNVSGATYCLYQGNTLVTCSPTGVFTNLPYDVPYCIRVKSSLPCYDTTMQTCFRGTKPSPSASNPGFSARTCSTATVKIGSVSNIPDPNYCLYTSDNVLIACNTTGQFTNVPYGEYYITVVTTSTTTDCSAITIKKPFSLTRAMPAVGASVTISNKTCTTFTASYTSSNFISPKFQLYNADNVLVATSTSSTFNNLAYGSYRLVATTSCHDTLIRSFSQAPAPATFSLSSAESCTIGTTDIKFTFVAGQPPFTLKVLNPLNSVIATQANVTTDYTFSALPGLPAGLQYRIVAISSCGKNDTLAVTPKTSLFTRSTTVAAKCPSALAGSGSGDIIIELKSTIGSGAPVIVKKNTTAVSINPASTTPIGANTTRYNFTELTPATYIVEYNISSCTKKAYDTIVLASYTFPDLKHSAAYQCDNNNFSVSAVAGGGVAPFNYEVIGSNPFGILPLLQTSSVFNILSDVPYSLVRMRAVDACGNGTLNDVSVLPLGQLTIRVDNPDCYSNNLTLSVDTIPNASYTWYLKKKINSTDSTLVATSQNYNIPYLLPTDTGTYVCKTTVNSGCLQRISYFNLKGDCSIILPVKIISFTGKLSGNDALLNWKVAQEDGVKEYQVERNIGGAGFVYIGSITATNDPAKNQYSFTDQHIPGGRIKYRLRIGGANGSSSYSNIVEISHDAVFITAAPNPVKQDLSINISAKTDAVYSIRLYGLSGQVIHQQVTGRIRSGIFHIQRNGRMPSGFYLVKVVNLEDGKEFTQKLIFE